MRYAATSTAAGNSTGSSRHRQVELEIVAEGTSELTNGIEQTELVERRRPEIADDSLDLDDERVDLVGDTVEELGDGVRVAAYCERSSCRTAVRKPE